MLNLDSKNIRFLARMGARGTLGQVVYDYLKDERDLYVVTADLMHASGFDRVKKDFPERLVNVGIAEQNLIGVSAGLARYGTPVIATSWAMFTSVRVADQVRNYMGYMQSNVKLIGMDSGFIQSEFSYSHTNPPDIAIMRTIPGIKILSPCDGTEIYKAVVSAIEYKGPVYIRLTGDTLMPIVYKDATYNYEIGKANILKKGNEIAIIATGNIVKNALDAADLLKDQIDCTVIDMHTIVPLDDTLLQELKHYKLIVTVEEHLKAGGLGSAIAEYYAAEAVKPRHIILGVDDIYTPSGTTGYVQEQVGLSSRQIAERIIKEFRS